MSRYTILFLNEVKGLLKREGEDGIEASTFWSFTGEVKVSGGGFWGA